MNLSVQVFEKFAHGHCKFSLSQRIRRGPFHFAPLPTHNIAPDRTTDVSKILYIVVRWVRRIFAKYSEPSITFQEHVNKRHWLWGSNACRRHTIIALCVQRVVCMETAVKKSFGMRIKHDCKISREILM